MVTRFQHSIVIFLDQNNDFRSHFKGNTRIYILKDKINKKKESGCKTFN